MIPWAVAAVLCAPLALSMLVFVLLMKPDIVLSDGMEKYIELFDRDFAPQPQDAPGDAGVNRGIVFATSSLARAIDGPKRLPGEGIELVLVPKTSASLLHFSLLIGPAIAARPDFVIVQSTLLVPTKWNAPPTAREATRFFWRRQVLALMPRFARSQARESVTPFLQRPPKVVPVEQWRDNLEQLTGKILPRDHGRREQMRAILLRFAEAGIPVLVVAPPSNEFSEAYFARVSEQARSTVGPAAGAAAIVFLEPSGLWPNEQFFDPLHMYPDHNESYRAWLSAAIAAALGD
jgi:hypothetical protein